ncbi:nitrilase-related carbon-nitrogen hydrolase [Roseomonas marmotae]|uniref:Glutamine-dependent NAD(+) synthetase n=1 Tax=Roseomonas marmotae TaxID=2768161 RepID=A0ABS3KG78_9PROT|nr:nitrilase-related carbon-nitrogen hydrolase [Roseomonas marmotae]MBO1076477.1 NAD+ synthase [Roseomonas marmotae]QTI77923.1 NAD+ synthase [Roseomonas marmotae]
MTERLRIALAPLNPHPGAVNANAARIRAARAEAAALDADLLVTPEFSLGGLPIEDLARDRAFQANCACALAELAAETADGGPGLILGGPWAEDGRLHDTAFLLEGGKVVARRARHAPPPDGAFDPGPAPGPVAFRGLRLGLMAGAEWQEPEVPETLAETGAEILLAIHASPFRPGAPERRIDAAVARVVETGLPLVALGQTGGQDEWVFDSGGFVLNADRSLAWRQPLFSQALALTEWRRGPDGWACAPQPLPAPMDLAEQLWQAMMLGLSDYLEKRRCPGVVVELNGSLGAALTALCAVDALGAGRVRTVVLPLPGEGAEEAQAFAASLGLDCQAIPIGPALRGFGAMLGEAAALLPPRIRATALMALAGTSGTLPLASDDRTALALGQGLSDGIIGGFSLLKELWASEVRDLALWRQAQRPAGALGPDAPALPEAAARPWSDLPPLATLDPPLRGLLEEGLDVETLATRGFDRATLARIWRLLDRAEYKRRQAMPGVRLGRHAFGRDRRYPLTNGFTDLIP